MYSGPHIWWNTFNNNKTLDRNKLIGSIALNYKVTNWLSATGRLGMDFTLNQFETRNNPIDLIGIDEGFYANELGRDQVLNNEFILTATKEEFFNLPIDVRFSIGGSQWERSQYGLRSKTNEWINPWLFALENSRLSTNENPSSEFRYNKKTNSIYSFLNLGYKDFVFVELTGRNDWTSSLPIDNNSYFYPSMSVSFLATEAFDIKSSILNFWKIRGAFAQTASDTDPFQIDNVYDISNFGGNQTASSQGTIPPIALKPQRASSFEIGSTFGLFDDKVNFDITYYYIHSYDQILEAPLPASSGANRIRINTGALENKGFEAILTMNVLQRKDLYWETSLNIGRNRNKVLNLGESGAEQLELANIWGLNGPAIVVKEGEDFGTIIGYDYVYHENGQPILNESGTHYQFTDNRVPIGNASPDLTGGWSNRIGYKGFQLSTLIDTKWGGDIYSGSYVTGLQNGQSPTTLIERQGGGLPYTDPEGNVRNIGVVLPGVYENGVENDQVVHYLLKYIPNSGGWGRWLSTPGVLDNSWIKLRELTLSYSFDDQISQKMKFFQSLTVSIVGRDLGYLYSSLPDKINPEGNNGSGNAQGLEWASFPGVRSIGFSINATF